MHYEKDLSRQDVDAVNGFLKTKTEAGMAGEQLNNLRAYCLLSLTAREDQDPIAPVEDVDSPMLLELEAKRKTIERNLIRETDQYLQEYLNMAGRHDFTVNPRMDDFIRPPMTMYEAYYAAPANVREAKDWPEGKLQEALGAFWPESNVSLRVVANAMRYKH